MDGFTPLEYHIDERMEMENSDMKAIEQKTQVFTRRDFLQKVSASMAGLFIAAPALSTILDDKNLLLQPNQVLSMVELPALAELQDALLVRIIDTSHPITEEEITDLVTPNLQKIPLKLEGIRAANENIRVHSLILPALENLFTQANSDLTGLFIHSGFRTYEEQAIAYSKSKDKLVVLKPGTSQHHSGLALDFTSSDIGKLVDISLHFENTKAAKWLEAHAWEYGFVPSYINSHDGIKNEPWHYLYMGKELAEAYMRLKSGGWYGDVFLLQHAVKLGMQQIVLDIP
jgi:LAS superfamily LD-carboxypeptidase LdcB